MTSFMEFMKRDLLSLGNPFICQNKALYLHNVTGEPFDLAGPVTPGANANDLLPERPQLHQKELKLTALDLAITTAQLFWHIIGL